jgi:HPt (histidine-containing phosphotransfer) domain-containing protein
MNDFITKPVDRATMARVIGDCIAGRGHAETSAAPNLVQAAAVDSSVTAGLFSIDPSGELLRDLVRSFHETVEARTGELIDAARCNQFGVVAAMAHEFKGASASLGLFTLAGVYNKFELLARASDSTIVSSIDELIREVRIALRGLDLLSPPTELADKITDASI